MGEPAEPRARAALLDEALAALDALWRGQPVHHAGASFRLDGATLRPRPVQRPRIPIWIGGQLTRRGPRERALRWDGACLYRATPPEWEDVTPDDVTGPRADAARVRGATDGFDIAVGGRDRRADEAAERTYVAALAEAGATWWHEYLEPATPIEAASAQIQGGPLR